MNYGIDIGYESGSYPYGDDLVFQVFPLNPTDSGMGFGVRDIQIWNFKSETHAELSAALLKLHFKREGIIYEYIDATYQPETDDEIRAELLSDPAWTPEEVEDEIRSKHRAEELTEKAREIANSTGRTFMDVWQELTN